MVCFYVLFGIWIGLYKFIGKINQLDDRDRSCLKPMSTYHIEGDGVGSTAFNFCDLIGFKSFSDQNKKISENIKLSFADIVLIWNHQPQNPAKYHLCV